jgi:hypothetical protein
VIEEKMSSRVCCIVESGHGFIPFGKVVEMTTIYLCPLLDGGLQVMKSMPHLQKGLIVMTGWRREGGAQALCV